MPNPEQEQRFGYQELLRAIEEVATNPGQLQLIVKKSPELIQRHGEELLSVVMRRCDLTTPAGSDCKLLALNACWKFLLVILTNSHVLQSTYESGALFMLDQLHHGVFSHDWTDSKMVKRAAFFASHVVYIAKAHSRFFLCAKDYTLVRRIVGLFISVSFTIATSELEEGILRSLYNIILLRLKIILECLGSASFAEVRDVHASVEGEMGINGIGPTTSFQNDCSIDLLYHCLSQSPVTEIMESVSGDHYLVRMVTAAASLACFLSTTSGLLHKLSVTYSFASHRCTQFLLRALIQWMPSASLEMGGAGMSQESSSSSHTGLTCGDLHFNPKETRLLVRITELASYLPLSALWEMNRCPTDKSSDSLSVNSKESETLRQQWIQRMVEVASTVLRKPNAKRSGGNVKGSDFFSLLRSLFTGFGTPHFQNAALLIEVYLRLFLQTCSTDRRRSVSMNQGNLELSWGDDGCMGHLWLLIQMGLLVFNEHSTDLVHRDEANGGAQSCYCVYKDQLQASLLVLIGAGSAILTGLAPSTLVIHNAQHFELSQPHIPSIFLTLADYCFLSFADECGFRSGHQEMVKAAKALETVHDAFDRLCAGVFDTNQFEKAASPFSNEACMVTLPLALRHLRFAFLGNISNARTEESLEQYHATLVSLQNRLASLTKSISNFANAMETKGMRQSSVDPIGCFLLTSSLLHEAAYFPIHASEDEVLIGCIRQWVELSLQLASYASTGSQAAFTDFLQYRAARSLLFFVESNTYLPVEQLHLSETAAAFLMRLLRTVDAPAPTEACATHLSDDSLPPSLLEAYSQQFKQTQAWQALDVLSSHLRLSASVAPVLSGGTPLVTNLLEIMHKCQASLCQLLVESGELIREGCSAAHKDALREDVSNRQRLHAFSQKRMRLEADEECVGSGTKSTISCLKEKEAFELSSRLRELLRVGQLVDSLLFPTTHQQGETLAECSNALSSADSMNATSPSLPPSVQIL